MNPKPVITNEDIDRTMSRATRMAPRKPPKPPETEPDPAPTFSAGGFGGEIGSEWPTIIPLDEGPKLPEFDPDWLAHPDLRAMVMATVEALEVSTGLAAMSALGFLSGAVTFGTDGADIEPHEGWVETPNIYIICGIASGTRKSQTYSTLARPIRDHEKLLSERAGPEVAAARSKRKTDEKRLQVLEAKAVDDLSAEPDRDALARALANEAIPALPRLLADDVTSEKLTSLLAEHGGCMILSSPEPDILGLLQGRYADQGGTNLAPFLKGYGGEELIQDRVKGGSLRVPRPLLSVVVTAQPQSLNTMVSDPVLRDRGLVNRFAFVVPPSNLGHRTGTGAPIPPNVAAAYAHLLQGILAHGTGTTSSEAPRRVVRFTAEADAVIMEFWRENEATMREDGPFHEFSGWASKLPGMVARIAGCMALATNMHTDHVDVRFVRSAIEIGRFLQAHALATFGAAGIDPDQQRARRILKQIRSKRLTQFTKRTMWQNLKGGSHQLVQRTSDLTGALDLLESYGYILRDEPNGKSYAVNPALWDESPPNPPKS